MEYTYEYPRAMNTVDIVVYGVQGGHLKILLIKRGREPYKDCWAFPGGFLNMDEDLKACASRELKEETGLELTRLRQFYTFGRPDRDPRGRVISTAFIGFVKIDEFENLKADDDAKDLQWFDIDKLPKMAFDHDEIFRKSLEFIEGLG